MMASYVLPKPTPQQAAGPLAGLPAGYGAPSSAPPKNNSRKADCKNKSRRYSKMIDEDDKASSQIKMMSQYHDRSEE